MKILHVTDSYPLTSIPNKDIYVVTKGFSDYKRFLDRVKLYNLDLIHFHGTGKETFGMYACIAWFSRVKILQTVHCPAAFSYWYTVKQLCIRFLYQYTICTSKFDMQTIDRLHIAHKSKRTLIYSGVDSVANQELPKKDIARSYVYKKIGTSFTKGIRIIGTIMSDDNGNGVEHLIDAAYLSDKYKNLTNTIFIIFCKTKVSREIEKQIHELHVEGICFVIEDFENAEEYIKAFDIFVSPRVSPGDLYTLLTAFDLRIPCIATRVGDTQEFESYVSTPLVLPKSAKFLTERIIDVIKNTSPAQLKAYAKTFVLPRKFTVENEKKMISEIYSKITGKVFPKKS